MNGNRWRPERSAAYRRARGLGQVLVLLGLIVALTFLVVWP